MFATFAGGYNRKPLPGLPDDLGEAEIALREGRLDEDGYRDAADAFVREILGEMAVVKLSMVGEGGVRAPDRVLPLIRGIGGLSDGGPATLPDGEPVTRPLVTGFIDWRGPIHVRDWEFAAGETELPVKQTLIGPYTLGVLAEPAPGPRRTQIARSLAEALNAELRALADAGCPFVEIDEPLALEIGSDTSEWQTFQWTQERLLDGLDGTGIHPSLGLWGGQIDPAGYGGLIDLPYASYLVDVLAGAPAWRFIDAVPAARGIIVGAADAMTEHWDETEVLVRAMAWAAEGDRGSARVGVAPNGGLWRLPRHFAHRKCQRMGEAVEIAGAGPLQDVAFALEEHPERSWQPEMRAMASAVSEARG
jgi:5-methyltetrahydropteroyltriglutamate--homocysteine methyltransferase